MPFKSEVVETKLKNKFGFSPAVGRESGHRWYELKIEGLPVISTKFSHGGKEINDFLESIISKQLRVRKPFFREMIGCTKSSEEYQEQVKEDPFPPFNKGF